MKKFVKYFGSFLETAFFISLAYNAITERYTMFFVVAAVFVVYLLFNIKQAVVYPGYLDEKEKE